MFDFVKLPKKGVGALELQVWLRVPYIRLYILRVKLTVKRTNLTLSFE